MRAAGHEVFIHDDSREGIGLGEDWKLLTGRVDLSPTAREFLSASVRRDRFRRGRAPGVLCVLLAGALVALGIAVDRQHSAQQQLHLATARLLATQATTLLGSDPDTALKLSIAAYRLSPGGETHATLFNNLDNLAATHYAGTLTGHTSSVVSVAFTPDGRTLASASTSTDRSVRVWDLSDRAQAMDPAKRIWCLLR